MTLIVIQCVSKEDAISQLRESLVTFWDKDGKPKADKVFALVLDGASLKFCLESLGKSLLLELGFRCKAVLFCRVSPLQKALVVKLVKEGSGAVCLAIGDGANDVSMIQEADIGVGISGKEGLQAVMASDYAIPQFRFLTKLLLVHGRWAYFRSAELVLNFFYKNIAMLMVLFWFQFYCGFTASLAIDFTYTMFFNTLFSILPTVLVGMFDQDISAALSLKTPQIYLKGIRQEEFSMERFWVYIGHGVYQSIICFFGVYLFIHDGNTSKGYDYDGTAFSTLLAFPMILIINIFGTTNWYSWSWINYASFTVSMLIWIIYLIIYDSTPGSQTFGLLQTLFVSPSFYAILAIMTAMTLIPRIIIKYCQQILYPSDTDLLREIHRNGRKVAPVALEVGVDSIPTITIKDTDTASIKLPDLAQSINSLWKSAVTDGFGFKGSISRSNTNQSGSKHTRTISVTKAVQFATQFVKSLAPKVKTEKRVSVVYMGTPDREGVPYTGYGFSQDRGMVDTIIANSNEEAKDGSPGELNDRRARYPNLAQSKLRNFSNSIQSLLGIVPRNSGLGAPPSDTESRQS